MHHCKRIDGGRSPPVNTKENWNILKRELGLITENESDILSMWLSARWSDTENVNDETLEAEKAVLRDFYTGQRINWTLPFNRNTKSKLVHTDLNCINAQFQEDYYNGWLESWFESQCQMGTDIHRSCPCEYSAQPLLRLRGRCSSSLIDSIFSPKQLPSSGDNLL